MGRRGHRRTDWTSAQTSRPSLESTKAIAEAPRKTRTGLRFTNRRVRASTPLACFGAARSRPRAWATTARADPPFLDAVLAVVFGAFLTDLADAAISRRVELMRSVNSDSRAKSRVRHTPAYGRGWNRTVTTLQVGLTRRFCRHDLAYELVVLGGRVAGSVALH